MFKQLKDLTIYEAWELSKKYCNSDNNLSSEEFDEMCGKCPFNSVSEIHDNCPLCNCLFCNVGELSRTDLEKTVEVDDDLTDKIIYANGEVYMTFEDKDAKIRSLQAEITKLLSDKKYLKDKVDRFKIVVDGY